jgi:ATP-dependent Clp protease protease subunit
VPIFIEENINYMASSKRNSSKLSRIITLSNIEGESVNGIIQTIYEINDEDAKKTVVEPIKLIINSFGGELYSGLALVDTIDNSLTPVHTICHGSAMSMALIVFSAGHKRFASKYATFMYHEASYETDGKISFHKQEIKETERTDKICDEYFLSKTKFNVKQLKDIRDKRAEWYFDVKIAHKYGMVDEIL